MSRGENGKVRIPTDLASDRQGKGSITCLCDGSAETNGTPTLVGRSVLSRVASEDVVSRSESVPFETKQR